MNGNPAPVQTSRSADPHTTWQDRLRAGSWLAYLPLGAIVVSFLLLAIVISGAAPTEPPKPETPSVFDMPLLQEQYTRLQRSLLQLFSAQRYEEAEQQCRALLQLIPHYAATHYNLACAQARQGQQEEAIASLAAAIEWGFNDASQLDQDADLESLRSDARFDSLRKAAHNTTAKPSPWSHTVTPKPIINNVGWVTEQNTVWDAANRVFRVLFNWESAPRPRMARAPGWHRSPRNMLKLVTS